MPSLAYSLKQMRQSPKSRIKPCLRPHLKQRRTIRVLNFGFFFERAITDVFAMFLLSLMFFSVDFGRQRKKKSFPKAWV